MKKVYQEMWKDKGKAIIVIFLTAISVLADLMMPNYMSDMINQGIPYGNIQYIILTGVKMLAVVILSMICTVISGYYSSTLSGGIGKRLRSQMFTKVENYSLGEFDHFSTSSLITRTTNDITQIQNFMMMFLRIIIMAPLMGIGGLILTAQKSTKVFNILAISVPVLLITVGIIAKIALPLSRSMQKKIDKVNLVMREKLTGLRVIRAFGTEAFEEKRFDEANKDLTATTMKMQRTMTAMMPLITLILNFSTIAIVWGGGQLVHNQEMMVGDIMAVVQYVMQIMMSLTMLSMVFVMYPRAAASAERINEVLDMPLSIQDGGRDSNNVGEKKGYLEFRDVTFQFPDSDEPALEHISFQAAPGQTTAIIGSTGSGKSTVVNLIPRFYDATQGQVLVDGIDVREYKQKDLRDKIGYVPQKALLFQGTITDNIRFGCESADNARIEKACEIAQAMDFIQNKPDKFDTEIAQGGTNVSGGQRQRLSIARAVVRHPEIYIFDDSFSALDFKTDSQLRKALKEETEDATVVIVAQRVSTIMDSDNIIVLDNGKMVGQGKHKDLLNTCSVYREIVLSQLSEKELA